MNPFDLRGRKYLSRLSGTKQSLPFLDRPGAGHPLPPVTNPACHEAFQIFLRTPRDMRARALTACPSTCWLFYYFHIFFKSLVFIDFCGGTRQRKLFRVSNFSCKLFSFIWKSRSCVSIYLSIYLQCFPLFYLPHRFGSSLNLLARMFSQPYPRAPELTNTVQ